MTIKKRSEIFERHMSIRIKILSIVSGFLGFLGIAFLLYSIFTTANYKDLRINGVSKTVEFECEKVNKSIAEMERTAIDLANSGLMFYHSADHTPETGEAIVIEAFDGFRTAVGGGIWYEPFAFNKAAQRVCFYAFYDPSIGNVRFDPEFSSETYDYHMQGWYTSISGVALEKFKAVWTSPYYDEIGTYSLMTTVGAGIFDGGRFVGMSTVDWQIESMVEDLSGIKPTENSFVLLASPENDYVISNTYENNVESAGTSLSGLAWYDKLMRPAGKEVSISPFVFDNTDYMAFSRIMDNGWLLSVIIPRDEIFSEIEQRNSLFSVIISVSVIVMLALAFYLVSLFINKPLMRLTRDVTSLGSGNLDRQISINTHDEIGLLASAFNKMTVDLKASIEANAHERAEKERIGAELNVATKIQASMLPCIFPAFPERDEFDVFASMLPAKEVGGDFYDFFLIGENKLAVVIADVSGKGVPAALFMVIAKTLIKNNAQYGKSPEETFEIVNNLLCENNEAGMFVTAFLAYLYVDSGKFTYVNAGHNPPLLKRAAGDFEWLPTKPGFVLAGMEDMRYKQTQIFLQEGDRLFMYTDGVTEAVNKENELFSDPKLLMDINRHNQLPVNDLLPAIKQEIDIFANGAEQADDITMLGLEFRGKIKQKIAAQSL